jgi:hypothetical protein
MARVCVYQTGVRLLTLRDRAARRCSPQSSSPALDFPLKGALSRFGDLGPTRRSVHEPLSASASDMPAVRPSRVIDDHARWRTTLHNSGTGGHRAPLSLPRRGSQGSQCGRPAERGRASSEPPSRTRARSGPGPAATKRCPPLRTVRALLGRPHPPPPQVPGECSLTGTVNVIRTCEGVLSRRPRNGGPRSCVMDVASRCRQALSSWAP